MKRVIYVLLAMTVLSSGKVFGQGAAPKWISGDVRNLQYPQSRYYSGFAEVSAAAGEGQEAAMSEAKQRAMNELSERLRVTVNSKKTLTNTSISKGSAEQIISQLSSVIQTGSQTEVTNSRMESWYNSKTRTAYAFAYADKAELASYYRKQIDVGLGKVDAALGIAGQLATAGKKISARRKVEEAKTIFGEAATYRSLLTAANPAADERALQAERENSLQRIVAQLLIQLEQSTFVYVSCQHERRGGKHDVFDSDPNILCGLIAQALSENDCSVTDNEDEADFELMLITSTTQRSDGSEKYGIISYYANARGTLYNRAANKTTVNFSILNDSDCYAGGSNPEDAATKAFKLPELTNKVLEKILPRIKD